MQNMIHCLEFYIVSKPLVNTVNKLVLDAKHDSLLRVASSFSSKHYKAYAFLASKLCYETTTHFFPNFLNLHRL